MCENKEPMVSYTIQDEVIQVPAYIEYLLHNPQIAFRDIHSHEQLRAINAAIVDQNVTPENFRKLIKEFST